MANMKNLNLVLLMVLVPCQALVSNILAIILSFLSILIPSKSPFWKYIPTAFTLSVFFSSINATKTPESDLLKYKIISDEMPGRNFVFILSEYQNEFGYYMANWFSTNYFSMSWEAWIFILTFFCYFVFLISLLSFSSLLGVNNVALFFLLLFFAFFPIIFSNSAHLLRQMMAGAVALFAIGRFISGQHYLILLIISFTIHVSALIFFFLPVVLVLARRFTNKVILLSIMMLVAILFTIRSLAGFSDILSQLGVPAIVTYTLQRFSQDSFFQLNDLSLFAIGFALFCTFCSVLALTHLRSDRRPHIMSHYYEIYSALTMYLLLSISPVIFTLSGLSEPAVRVFLYVCLGLPVPTAYLVGRFSSARTLATVLGLVMPFIFFYYFELSPWIYENAIDVLMRPAVSSIVF